MPLVVTGTIAVKSAITTSANHNSSRSGNISREFSGKNATGSTTAVRGATRAPATPDD
jgi:hypothetical protein